jgi:hypothetical protein
MGVEVGVSTLALSFVRDKAGWGSRLPMKTA